MCQTPNQNGEKKMRKVLNNTDYPPGQTDNSKKPSSFSKPRFGEPPPTAFYAPQGMFTPGDLKAIGATYLGDRVRLGGTQFTISSAPLCRLYWNDKGKAEADCIESNWIKDTEGKWKKQGNNYLSYQLANGDFCTPKFGLL